jgi:hypothetical protein
MFFTIALRVLDGPVTRWIVACDQIRNRVCFGGTISDHVVIGGGSIVTKGIATRVPRLAAGAAFNYSGSGGICFERGG